MPIADPRDGGYNMIAIQLFTDLLRILPPLISRNPAKLHKFEEVNIPKKMRGGLLIWTA